MLLAITDVTYLQDYILELTFNNGSKRRINLQHELDGEIFDPLKDLAFFKRVMVNPETNTIEWPNGADFAPEFLYEQGEHIHESGMTPAFSPQSQRIAA